MNLLAYWEPDAMRNLLNNEMESQICKGISKVLAVFYKIKFLNILYQKFLSFIVF